jgi:dipeptidyl aminopeptidase/acylaminoacyl peptidase
MQHTHTPRRRLSNMAVLAKLALASSQPLHGQKPALGDFLEHADVGAPRIAGSAAYNPVSQEYSLAAAGTNMWAARDEFHFVWRGLKGDFILQSRVDLQGTGVDPHRKAGLMIRSTLDADAPYVDAVVHGDGLVSLQFRRSKGGVTEERQSPVKGANVLQLERRGNTYVLSAARFGDVMASTEVADLPLGDEVMAGLALCSHNPDVVERAVFGNVRIVRPARENFTPYRDYIGSVLELLDVSSGQRQAILRSTDPFEAPNWTRDGAALIYNTSGRSESRGRLVRFDLATRQPSTIETGSIVRNNNDHVLSFDGTMLGMSDSSAGGGSTVYTVPVSGGTPKRITTLSPSYLHSWSPDGKSLLYTAGRNGEFDIYSMPADANGPEVRITTAKGLDDGPEFTPDGKYIYFNSVRGGGLMQIWRMKPDGSAPEQMTNDDFNNWFPHISPDGQWIAFISFPKDVRPDDHPYYKQVYLRLMPIGGGAPKVIGYVYGGQGTINVPSWSPDGKMLAFVSNSH